jgi:hypothetical protein
MQNNAFAFLLFVNFKSITAHRQFESHFSPILLRFTIHAIHFSISTPLAGVNLKDTICLYRSRTALQEATPLQESKMNVATTPSLMITRSYVNERLHATKSDEQN